MTQLLLTTTGTPTSFRIPDLGTGFDHPVVDQDLMATWNFERLRESSNLQAAVDAGKCTLKDDEGNVVTNVKTHFSPQLAGKSWDDIKVRAAPIETTKTTPFGAKRSTFTPAATSATYIISWYAEVTTNNKAKAFRCSILLDGVTEIGEFVDNPSVSGEYKVVTGWADGIVLDNTEHYVDFMISAVQKTSVKARRIRIRIKKQGD